MFILFIIFFFFNTGTSANDLHFQAFLLEGLVRWNRDRELAAVTLTDSSPSSYDCALTSAVNLLSHSVLGRELYPNFKGPNKYTGIAQTDLDIYNNKLIILSNQKPFMGEVWIFFVDFINFLLFGLFCLFYRRAHRC